MFVDTVLTDKIINTFSLLFNCIFFFFFYQWNNLQLIEKSVFLGFNEHFD